MKLTPEIIKQIVADYCKMDVARIDEKTREADVVAVRHLAIYFCTRFADMGLYAIATNFNLISHATVLHAVSSVNNRVDTEAEYRSKHNDILKRLRAIITANEGRSLCRIMLVRIIRIYYFRRNRIFKAPKVSRISSSEPAKSFVNPYDHLLSCTNKEYSGYRVHQL